MGDLVQGRWGSAPPRPRCGSMQHVETGSEDYYIRCQREAGHAKRHRSSGDKWSDDEAGGYMEESA